MASKREKVSDLIIEKIRDEILSGRRKAGDRLASEKELVSEYGLSKASVREALRVLEVMGLIEIRQGVSGGIYVAEVDMKATLLGITNFLHFKSVSISDLTMLRYLLEPSLAKLAATSATQQDLVRLGSIIARESQDPIAELSKEISFHRYLARLSNNPLLILIMDFVDNILNDFKVQLDLDADFFSTVEKMHRTIHACLVKRDGEGAAKATAEDLLVVGNFLADLTGSPRFDPVLFTPNPTTGGVSESDATEFAHDSTLAAIADVQKNGLVLKKLKSGDLYMFVEDPNR